MSQNPTPHRSDLATISMPFFMVSMVTVPRSWNKWFKRFGINRLEPVRSRLKVEKYTSKHCANYLTKGFGHYDFKLNDPGLWAQATNATASAASDLQVGA